MFDGSEPINGTEHEHNIWTAENGYQSKEMRKFPRPAIGSGNENGLRQGFHHFVFDIISFIIIFFLSLILRADTHDYYCTATRSYGFKVLLHSPNDLPKVSDYGFAVPTNFETRIAIEPTLSTASHAIKNIAQNIRQCVFNDESQLTLYK